MSSPSIDVDSSGNEIINYVIHFLNDLLLIDNNAVQELFRHRVRCNEMLANHPTVQVRSGPTSPDESGYPLINENEFDVGFIGILNGLLGVDQNTRGYIAVAYEDGKIVKFMRTK